jgi:23S rRNA (cytosine1962-C5)-methyltransferase
MPYRRAAMTSEPTITVRPGRERSLLRRHPWVFGGSVQRVTGDPTAGDTVRVIAADGRPLGRGAYSPHSQLVVRMWTFDDDVIVDDAFVAARVSAAAERRRDLAGRTDAFRLVFAESDGMPGAIVDRYGGWVVVELNAAGADHWRDAIADAVATLPGVRGVYERSDVAMREREGLTARIGLLRGDEPPERIEIHEDGRVHLVDVRAGHKTGFYLDQRDNRSTVAALARDRRVLDVFAYTGGFSVAAHIGGAASVTTVDSSGPALALAAENLRLNGAPTDGLCEADAFAELRRRRALGERFDLIVLDPPKLANNAAQVDKATRAYKDANLQAFGLLSPGGVLVTFSCSGAIDEALFQKVVFGAALDAKRDAWIVDKLTQASDHPVALTFPEAAYLKGLVVRVA